MSIRESILDTKFDTDSKIASGTSMGHNKSRDSAPGIFKFQCLEIKKSL